MMTELTEKLMKLGTCAVPEVLDVGGGSVQAAVGLRPVWTGARLCAPAFPVRGKGGDNLAMHQALYHCPPGLVIVAAVEGYQGSGHWGGLMATAAKARGIAGMVIDGAARDIDEFEELDFPVFAGGVHPRKSTKEHPGEVNVPVTCAGLTVNPGDIVLADVHGVAVIASAALDDVLAKVDALKKREADIVRRIQGGEVLADILGLKL